MHTSSRYIRYMAIAAFFMVCAFRLPAQTTITTPFALNLHCQNQFPTSVCDSVYTLPASTRLEIKNLSFDCLMPNGATILSLTVETTVGGVLADVTPALPSSRPSIANATYESMRFTQMAEIYADPGSKITLIAYLNESAPTQQFSCVVGLQGLKTAPIATVALPPAQDK